MKQHGCEAAVVDNSALFHWVPVCSAVLWWDVTRKQSSVFSGKGKWIPWVRGAGLDKSPHPCPWLISLHVNEDSKKHGLVGDDTDGGYRCTSPIGWGKPQFYCLKSIPGSHKGWLRWQKHSEAGSSVWEADSTAGFSKSAVCVKGPCVETSTILCFLKFKLVLIGIFFLRVHSCHLFCFCFYNVEMNILMCAFLNSYKNYIWKISF